MVGIHRDGLGMVGTHRAGLEWSARTGMGWVDPRHAWMTAQSSKLDSTVPADPADTAQRVFRHTGWQVVRAVLIGAMLVASTPAWADPSTSTLQIRLTVVEACSGEAGTHRCPVPQQRSDAAQLPDQVRDLAPPSTNDEPVPAVTIIY